MMSHWWCMDCLADVDLNKHGRCGCCDSEAVDPVDQRGGVPAQAAMAEASASNSSNWAYRTA
jgi:hypothetical protein